MYDCTQDRLLINTCILYKNCVHFYLHSSIILGTSKITFFPSPIKHMINKVSFHTSIKNDSKY